MGIETSEAITNAPSILFKKSFIAYSRNIINNLYEKYYISNSHSNLTDDNNGILISDRLNIFNDSNNNGKLIKTKDLQNVLVLNNNSNSFDISFTNIQNLNNVELLSFNINDFIVETTSQTTSQTTVDSYYLNIIKKAIYNNFTPSKIRNLFGMGNNINMVDTLNRDYIIANDFYFSMYIHQIDIILDTMSGSFSVNRNIIFDALANTISLYNGRLKLYSNSDSNIILDIYNKMKDMYPSTPDVHRFRRDNTIEYINKCK